MTYPIRCLETCGRDAAGARLGKALLLFLEEDAEVDDVQGLAFPIETRLYGPLEARHAEPGCGSSSLRPTH